MVSLISGQGHIICFTNNTIDITYITESGRKKNKQAGTWVSSKHKKGEVLALYRHSVAIVSEYPNEIFPQLPGTLTLALADLASGSASSDSSLQQPPLSDRRLSLTATNSCLFRSRTFPFLVFFRSRRISRAQDKGILLLAHTQTHRTNAHHRATASLMFHSYFSVINIP